MVHPEVIRLFGVLVNGFLCREISPGQVCDRVSKKSWSRTDVA